MSKLSASDKRQLLQWINTTKHLKLIYQATIDGVSSASFHEKCSNKGPTVVVCWNTDDCVFGGYTSMSWTASGAQINDTTAFTFQLYTVQGVPKKVKFTPSGYIYSSTSCGPHFRTGYESLVCFNDPVTKAQNGVLTSNGSFTSSNSTIICNNNFNYKEVLVYQFVDKIELLEEPWRKEIQEKTPTLKKVIEDYKPVNGGDIKQYKLLLIGCVGAGKSSYFNTVNSIFRGHVTGQAASGSAEHSLTTKFRTYQIRSGTKHLNFRLCDTRGLEESQGLDTGDIAAMLDGHIPDKYSFNPFAPITPETPGYIKTPSLNDKIHCVAFIIDGSSVDVMNENILSQFKSIQKQANQRGIPQVIILTKVDEISEEVDQDLSNMFYSTDVCEAVDRVSQLIGLPRGHVLPVKNYEKETELNEVVDRYALISLQQMLRFADDFVYDVLDSA